MDWNTPRTEEGLQRVLRQLEACQAGDDKIELGNGLLALAFLVKWVRSDTAQSPFVRSHELSLEAVEAFRQAGDERGQVRALVSASAMADPKTKEEMLGEAERLADSVSEEYYVALVLITRARSSALSDEERSSGLFWKALEIYRRTDNRHGQAQCLFSLSLGVGTSAEKRDYALEAARLNRELGNFDEASRCVSIALMNAEEIAPLVDLEDLVQEGLQDALNAGDRSQEGYLYGKLAMIEAARGHEEEADKYRRWAAEIEDADGLTPLERWKNNIEMTKMMIAMAKTQGHQEAAKGFREELKRLKLDKPKS